MLHLYIKDAINRNEHYKDVTKKDFPLLSRLYREYSGTQLFPIYKKVTVMGVSFRFKVLTSPFPSFLVLPFNIASSFLHTW